MKSSVEKYWEMRLETCRQALEENNFDAFIVADAAQARELVLLNILPDLDVNRVSWGGSVTLDATGLVEYFRNSSDFTLIETFDTSVSREEVIQRRRDALSVDLFLSGTNAITESGMLVNLDMIGNRVGGMVFGPRNVIIVAGRNKIVSDLDDAMKRIREFSAPANAIRLSKQTPCVLTSCCSDCKSPDRICNVWTIHEKSYPKGRIKVLLINQDLGL